MTLEQAKRKFTNRFTMEHVPQWAHQVRPDAKFYAPQYRSDEEWFNNTLFPPNNPISRTDCYSANQSWPLGKWLDAPFRREHA